ncbi:hypothetical protein LZ30DRAFT_736407 [Colletotrichum cereale]|nr:hypothetical protein LZ30DRAFT_736407 [Colletotrichum cereale]
METTASPDGNPVRAGPTRPADQGNDIVGWGIIITNHERRRSFLSRNMHVLQRKACRGRVSVHPEICPPEPSQATPNVTLMCPSPISATCPPLIADRTPWLRFHKGVAPLHLGASPARRRAGSKKQEVEKEEEGGKATHPLPVRVGVVTTSNIRRESHPGARGAPRANNAARAS